MLRINGEPLDCLAVLGEPRFKEAELVFCTSHSGYAQCCTDPSYAGQALVLTSALVGSHGVIATHLQSSAFQPAIVICQSPAREFTELAVALGGCVAVVRSVRALVKAARAGAIISCDSHVNSTAQSSVSDVRKQADVLIIDFGCKISLERALNERGLSTARVRPECAIREMSERRSAVLLSNGPGDPSADLLGAEIGAYAIKLGVPVSGVCYGHQLLCIAAGMRVKKLGAGHRGTNHPVMCAATGAVIVTSHNHGYAVDRAPSGSVTYTSLLDGTVEGVQTSDFMSVQFHPEGSPGPRAESVMDAICESLRGHRE